MSTIAAISVLRSAATTARISTVRLTGGVKPRTAPSPFRISSQKPLSARMSLVEMSSISVVSMLPYHSATASAVLTSMLFIAPLGHGWSIEVHLFKYLKEHDSVVPFAFVDPTSVPGDGDMSGNGRLLIERLTDSTVDIIFLIPFNTVGHWILIVINDTKDNVYFLDSLGNRTPYDNWKIIMVSAVRALMHPRKKIWCPPLNNSRYGGGPVRDKYYSQAQYDEVLDD
ncbi:hypothetical protein OROHE_003099 [Orobanche hederae]